MSRHWDAPQIAYELAADWAERAKERAAGSGGARDPFTSLPGMGKLWLDLRTTECHDVIGALASQARSASYEYTKRAGFRPGERLTVLDTEYAHRMCEEAVGALRELASPGGGEWKMPECSHCASLLAEALINIEITALLGIGVADPSAVLRWMAENIRRQGASMPEQRKAADDTAG